MTKILIKIVYRGGIKYLVRDDNSGELNTASTKEYLEEDTHNQKWYVS